MIRQPIPKPAGTGRTIFHLANGELHAATDLYWKYPEEFENACAKRLESRKSKLLVDVSNAHVISSSCLGFWGKLRLKVIAKKRIVLRVTLGTSWLFDIMGGPKILDFDVV